MINKWKETFTLPIWPQFKKLETSQDWFEVYEINSDLYVIHEPRHYEASNATLVIGKKLAVLIDTGCGLGKLREIVEAITRKPILIINTHTHSDHIGGNQEFDEIALFDHPLSRQISRNGINSDQLRKEISDVNLIISPSPPGFQINKHQLPPFEVNYWLQDGDVIDLGDRQLEVIFTPGEAVNHICLLDRINRILFSGDILLRGPVWTHLEGADPKELVKSYKKLMKYYEYFDYVMPSHNEPWLNKDLLIKTLSASEKVLRGEIEAEQIIDPWKKELNKFDFGEFSILTKTS